MFLDKHSRNSYVRNKKYQKVITVDEKKEDDTDGDMTGRWLAPEIFSLDGKARTILLKSITALRRKIGELGEDVILDFTKTEKVFAEGMLLFYAELKRLLRHTRGKVEIGCIPPHNSKVAQILKQLGILDLLGVKVEITPVDHDVVNWRAASGNLVLGSKYDEILQKYDGEIAPCLQENLYTGITESMTNVLNHAYDLTREDGLEIVEETSNWWMFSHQVENFLTVVFCDLGAGIPRTLPLKRKKAWNRLRRKGLRSDSEIIKFAVKDSVSRTRKSHRGKGLRQIVHVVEGLEGGEVAVLSNSGVLVMKTGSNTRTVDYSDTIMGTLIFWKIPLHAKEAV